MQATCQLHWSAEARSVLYTHIDYIFVCKHVSLPGKQPFTCINEGLHQQFKEFAFLVIILKPITPNFKELQTFAVKYECRYF